VGGFVNLVAIETATPACAVGVRTATGVEVSRVFNDGRRHTEALALAIGVLLDEVGLTPRDVTRVVVDRGPGLFTGLRVGIATAIAFAEGLGAELVGVTSLEMLAHGAFDDGVRGSLVSCVDGRRGEIFVQSFELERDVRAISEPEVALPSAVAQRWGDRGEPVTFTGDGVIRYESLFAGVASGSLFTQPVPSVHAALSLGAAGAPSDVVTPLYLREADAVANFATRERPS
jgi:tRNA threonylcarbamoyl adenosine modification protein YeaZ